jgi:hypothetical protein
MLSNTSRQKNKVMKIEVEEEEADSDTPPAFPHKMSVPEKAITQKGHLGSMTNNIVVSHPSCFFL